MPPNTGGGGLGLIIPHMRCLMRRQEVGGDGRRGKKGNNSSKTICCSNYSVLSDAGGGRKLTGQSQLKQHGLKKPSKPKEFLKQTSSEWFPEFSTCYILSTASY